MSRLGREENSNGPTHTGSCAKLLPSFLSCAGERIMPARSARMDVSGANGLDRCSTTVFGPVTSTLCQAVEFAGARGLRIGQVLVQRGLHRRGVERCPVVEQDPLLELNGVGQPAVGDDRERGGELGHDVQLRVDVIQLLAHVGEHRAPVEGGTRRRVEGVRRSGEADGDVARPGRGGGGSRRRCYWRWWTARCRRPARRRARRRRQQSSNKERPEIVRPSAVYATYRHD